MSCQMLRLSSIAFTIVALGATRLVSRQEPGWLLRIAQFATPRNRSVQLCSLKLKCIKKASQKFLAGFEN